MRSFKSYRLLFTCKPSQNYEEFLAFNELVHCCLRKQLPCTIINRLDEVPADILKNASLDVFEPPSSGRRPILSDYAASSDAPWLIIANSDIWLEMEVEKILKALEIKDVDFASSQRWDLPDDVRISDFDFDLSQRHIITELTDISKRQSMRTLDLFIVRKSCLQMAILFNQEISELMPGTSGWDNNFFGLMPSVARTADLSSVLNIFHTNHEPFRKVFGRNYVVNRGQQASFVKNREEQRSLLTTKGCLSWADYRLVRTHEGFSLSHNKHKNIRYYIESARVKITNLFDNWSYLINKKIYNIISLAKAVSPSVDILCGHLIVHPKLTRRAEPSAAIVFEKDVTDLLDTKTRKWKLKFKQDHGQTFGSMSNHK